MPLDAADLAQFVHPDMPGYAQATYNAQTIDALFVSQFDAVLLGDVVQADEKHLLVRVGDVPGIAQGSSITVGAQAYKVMRAEAHSIGTIILRVAKA